jgi:hypothetical protein
VGEPWFPADEKEDVERTIKYFKNDGIDLRFNNVGFKTKYYCSQGGMGNLEKRIPHSVEAVQSLLMDYPEYGKLKTRKNGIHEFELKNVPAFSVTPADEPEILPKINPEEFAKLYGMLNNFVIPFKEGRSSRHGFEKHRAMLICNRRARFGG